MGNNFKFIVNNKIDIVMTDGLFRSNIQDLTDEYIGISVPVLQGKYLPIRKGERVEVLYYIDKDIYGFNTVVLGKKIDKVFIVLLAHPKKVKMVQRRNYVRILISLEINCAVIDKEKDKTNNQYDFFSATTVDISGGGVSIISDRSFRYADQIMLTIPLATENITVVGKVVRVNKKDDGKNIYGLSYINIDNNSRDRLISFIFHKMRDSMKKGVGGEM